MCFTISSESDIDRFGSGLRILLPISKLVNDEHRAVYRVNPFLANYHSFTTSCKCNHFQLDSMKYFPSNNNPISLFTEVNRMCD